MNRQSIFLKIRLFFIISFLAISTTFILMYKVGKNEREKYIISSFTPHIKHLFRMVRIKEMQEFPQAFKHRNRRDFKRDEHYKKRDFGEGSEHEHQERRPPPLRDFFPEQKFNTEFHFEKSKIFKLIENETHIDAILKTKPFFIPNKKRSDVAFYLYEDHAYIYMHKRFKSYMVQFKHIQFSNSNLYVLALLYSIIISVIITLYFVLKRTLVPIKDLEANIIAYGKGEEITAKYSPKKDEISTVSNEFYSAIDKITALQAARTLFLRNIMHELKTPITKGRLSTALMEESEDKELLENVFIRLENLINEMGDIERITSKSIELHLKEYRILDMIDNAIDLLFINPHLVEHSLHDESVHADFKLFSIVIKNLIDNAIKYADDGKISIMYENKKLLFKSAGKVLPYPFEQYIEPFYKGELSTQNQKGFGLGFYIIHEIVKKHQGLFRYEHLDGFNIFSIALPKVSGT